MLLNIEKKSEDKKNTDPGIVINDGNWVRIHQPFSRTFFLFLRGFVNLNVTQLGLANQKLRCIQILLNIETSGEQDKECP